MPQREIQYWAIPSEADAEFIAAMEDVLDTYEQPVIRSCAWMSKPIAVTTRHAHRVDYEYERCGTVCVFLFTEALSGW